MRIHCLFISRVSHNVSTNISALKSRLWVNHFSLLIVDWGTSTFYFCNGTMPHFSRVKDKGTHLASVHTSNSTAVGISIDDADGFFT